jgi:hypothetical protein
LICCKNFCKYLCTPTQHNNKNNNKNNNINKRNNKKNIVSSKKAQVQELNGIISTAAREKKMPEKRCCKDIRDVIISLQSVRLSGFRQGKEEESRMAEKIR